MDRAKEWAIRCFHESQMHDENSFVTLTYSPENLPHDGSLRVSDLQKFMKRLRKKFAPKKIRFFACGEYGENLARPHYHLLLFGLAFPDQYFFKNSGSGNALYRSPTLEKIWTFGHSLIGDVTFESAGYVARYILKKINGDLADDHYLRADEHGEAIWLAPEFTTMSRSPGIAKSWYDKYSSDIFPGDFAVTPEGKKVKTPRYYSNLLEREQPDLLGELKLARQDAFKTHQENNTDERLRVRETCHEAKTNLLTRDYEK